jgi:serine/threonine protein phosphatase PrpC
MHPVKQCPTCGASCADGDLFCEADGTKLSTGAPPAPETSRKAPRACDACGAEDTDDGDGYCTVCGHRLGSTSARAVPEPTAPPALAKGIASPALAKQAAPPTLAGLMFTPGTRLGAYLVRHASGDRVTASTPDGTEVALVLGAPPALAHEAELLGRLGAHPAFPRLVDRDEAGGYLTLSAPPPASRTLADVLQRRNVGETVAVIRGLLEAAATVEAAGFAFEPLPSDLLLGPGGAVLLARARGARPLAKGEHVDARRMLQELGNVLLAPAILGPTRLVRLLAPSRDPGERTIGALLAELNLVAAEVDQPHARAHLAELCDAGLWRPYNQDATAVEQGRTAAGEPYVVLVVCDGVSSSSFSERASRLAARAARDALGHFARSLDIEHDSAAAAMAQAIRAAHLAICAAHVADPVAEPPGTTIAAALVHKRRLTVGWVGDTRAYWLTPRGAELLTHDHSWVNEAIARGEVKDPEEVQGALAHTITKCLGPLEVGDVPIEIEPDVRTRDLAGPGVVLLCTDGLWNYASKPADMAAVLRAAADEADAVEVSRLLINYALARGGQDNVSVAVYAYG